MLFNDVKPVMRFQPWKHPYLPRKILAIRFQALGDTVVSLPYLQSLKRQFPEIELHFITKKEVCDIPKNIHLFDKVFILKGGRSARLQFLFVLLKLPSLIWQSYDAVLDLQNNRISILLRKLLWVKAWSEFDKYSPLPAGERMKLAIEALGGWKISLDTNFKLDINIEGLLSVNNWKKDHDIVLLNPAGCFSSRSWPLSYYVEFAKLWIKHINVSTQFLLLLLPAHKEKADFISRSLKDKCIDLTGKANQLEAFAILQKCKFVLSEDSGLMHMAWIQKIPTLALFSSSKRVWSAPQGKWSICLDSSDMECGPCMKEVCKYNDNRCLTRFTPEFVLARAIPLIRNLNLL